MKITKEQKLFQQVVQKAWENETFKQDLIANPVATIEKFTGKKIHISNGKKLVIVDQSNAENLYINIPTDFNSIELSEEQLEAVAGGTNPITRGEDCFVGDPWGNPPPFYLL